MGFITASFSHKGGRSNNEDALYYCTRGNRYIAIVADGLGMHGGGEIASATVVEAIAQCYFEEGSIDKHTIVKYIDAANRAVLSLQTAACRMKSTGVVLFAHENKLAFAHVGDSRLYHFSGGRLIFQTVDHSVSQMAVISGEIIASQIRFHEDRNRLLRAFGGSENIRPDITLPHSLANDDDSFLLCSDGFWEYVWEDEMEIDLVKSATPGQWLSFLLERIGQRVDGKHDNLSAVATFYRDTEINTVLTEECVKFVDGSI